jgi:multiple sugar transport system substrate-binding protein
MSEIEFSLIGEPSPELKKLLAAFESEHRIQIRIREMDWEHAWADLVTCALFDSGPDVSHIGSTWTSSLSAMNALRVFSDSEVQRAGGAAVFLPQAWQSGDLPGQPGIWSLPWTAYTFLLCYRRDLLEANGIDEKAAFTTPAATEQTLRQLQLAGVKTPWVLPVEPGFVDILHHTASWVWGAGGDFLSPDEHKTLLLQPDTLGGLKSYLDLLVFMRHLNTPLTQPAAQELFAQGDAAVTILGVGEIYEILNSAGAAPVVMQNLGVAPVPGVPWIGGDNLVIWKHTRGSAERERAAVELVTYLTSHAAQAAYAQGAEVQLPTRLDALPAIPGPETVLTQAVVHSLRTGRAYWPARLWARFETQVGNGLCMTAQAILSGEETEKAMQHYLVTLARRLEITLSS